MRRPGSRRCSCDWAWSKTLAGHMQVKPWPWADTWPVGRLRVPSEEVDVIVLNGAYGRTLAFGPAFAESSSLPGAGGTTVLTGHRDTHFAFMRRLKAMDEILIDTPDGHSLRYRVIGSAIVDARTDAIRLADDKEAREELILVTCYPFDALFSGSPLRYLVRAVRTRDRSIGLVQAASLRDRERNRARRRWR